MKKLLYMILAVLFVGCRSEMHPLQARVLNPEGFEVVEDLTASLGLEGVYAFRVKRGKEHYILVDTGFTITLTKE